ncbi:replication factor C large subunit [Candidatus Bathyarchaeota archaeon]|nr:replication factor C large subunit [Candidatus Bathyarchaeota archaeon]
MNVPWTIKYKPKTLDEVVGNKEAKDAMLKWIREWDKNPPRKRALFMYGPPGTGKTVAAEALANDLAMELVQNNASNYRTAEAVQKFAGIASQYTTLFGKKRLILFDELDGIAGTADRGGLREITEVIKITNSPIVLTANNAYDPRFSTLREHCQLVEFKKPTRTEIEALLKKICSREGIEAEVEALKLIAERASGDLRSAINDLQALSQGKKRLTYEDVSWLSTRDRKDAIFKVLSDIFYARSSLDARRAVEAADVDLDMLFEWIYENAPYQIKNPKELSAVMEMLAIADLYRGRIGSTQNWELIRYCIDFMTVGVAVSWSHKSSGWVPFKFPTRIMSMSQSRAEREILTAIGLKIGKRCHISATRAIKEVIPYLRVIFQSNDGWKKGLSRWFDLDEGMVNYLLTVKN